MRKFASACSLSAAFILSFTALTLADPPNKPRQILDAIVGGMPQVDQQELRVLTAVMQPGEKSAMHTHLFPVTLYIMQGELTLDMKGKPSVTAHAGEAVVEQPNTITVATNSSATETTKVVLFYASQPNTPFLIPAGMR